MSLVLGASVYLINVLARYRSRLSYDNVAMITIVRQYMHERMRRGMNARQICEDLMKNITPPRAGAEEDDGDD